MPSKKPVMFAQNKTDTLQTQAAEFASVFITNNEKHSKTAHLALETIELNFDKVASLPETSKVEILKKFQAVYEVLKKNGYKTTISRELIELGLKDPHAGITTPLPPAVHTAVRGPSR